VLCHHRGQGSAQARIGASRSVELEGRQQARLREGLPDLTERYGHAIGAGIGGGEGLPEVPDQPVEEPAHGSAKQVRLGAEVLEERTLRHPCPATHLGRGGAGVAALDQALDGRVEQALLGGAAARLDRLEDGGADHPLRLAESESSLAFLSSASKLVFRFTPQR